MLYFRKRYERVEKEFVAAKMDLQVSFDNLFFNLKFKKDRKINNTDWAFWKKANFQYFRQFKFNN